MELGRFLGFLHPALVHFPLVLLLLSVVLEAVGFFRRDPRYSWAAQLALLGGMVATMFTFVAGNFAHIFAARNGIPQEPIERHEWLATLTSWSFVALASWRLFMGAEPRRKTMAIYLTGAVLASIMLCYTGHSGAMLVHEHGAGVQASGLMPFHTEEELLALNDRLDPDGIFYSNLMHHVFGWLVLALSVLLLLDLFRPQLAVRLRKLSPLLLFLGGIGLFIFSEPDGWPLAPTNPFLDREALLHKTLAVLTTIVGALGLWRRKNKNSEEEEAKAGRQWQHRTMAAFALVGGALLFTHIHTVGPYANRAVGIYIHHTVMGSVALLIGGVKLLEDVLPKENRLRRSRGWPYLYPSFMALMALLLIKYNEGLPWFLGYQEVNPIGPHGGLVAAVGNDRAEITFDPKTAILDLYLVGANDANPRAVKADTIQTVLRVGTDATLVPLSAVPGSGGNHFQGRVAFLRDAPAFLTQAVIPRPDNGLPTSVEFEMWVDARRIAKPSKAAFVCPMHPAIGSDTPAACSECGMNLVPNRPPRPAGQLHDPTYKIDLAMAMASEGRVGATAPILLASKDPVRIARGEKAAYLPVEKPIAGKSVRLTFTPRRADGTVVSALDVVHTKKLHLIMVSGDLAYFDHVHPEPQADGSLILDYTFPQPGDYVLFADLTPAGDRNQVFRLPVTVEGAPRPKQPLRVTPVPAKVYGDYRVALQSAPTPLLTSDETQLQFTLTENGKPVTDLEPFLGASGHCVMIAEDTQTYLHSHPLETSGTRFGPSIVFHTQFPRRGRYKIWAQFQHRGQPLTADFVVEVP